MSEHLAKGFVTLPLSLLAAVVAAGALVESDE